MAIDSTWITVACLLATFTFSKPKGEIVRPMDKVFNPDLFQSGLVACVYFLSSTSNSTSGVSTDGTEACDL